MASLPDDLIVEILSRLPVKSLCRCKAVSRHWRYVISHPDLRRKFSRTLPGLFYRFRDHRRFPWEAWHFTHVWESPRERHPLVCPFLSFLPGYEHISILDSSNGMLLCRFSESSLRDASLRYVVCNPVEMRMIVLPDSGCGADKRVARLAFDPALYPETRVIEFVSVGGDVVVGVNIYSKESGEWSYKEGGWGPEAYLLDGARCVFYHGFLHLVSGYRNKILVVDVEGDTWRTIPLPDGAYYDNSSPGFVGIYKDHLCFISEVEKTDEGENTDEGESTYEVENTGDLSIWILEDYTKGDWVVKHRVSKGLLCTKQTSQYRSYYFNVFGILQDCNFILYVAGTKLMAYDTDNEEVHAIQYLERGSYGPYFLYVPFYTD